MIDWSTCKTVESIEGKVSGTYVFRNTRIPVSALFENLDGGATINDFMSWFPGVFEDQINEVISFYNDEILKRSKNK